MANGEPNVAPRDSKVRQAQLMLDALDLQAQYLDERDGGDFSDAVRVGTRVVFLLGDIAGRRKEAGPIAARTCEILRTKAVELFAAGDVNLMEGTELLVQAINLAIAGPARLIHFAPTFVGCYDLEHGVLAYVNAGGQTAAIRDADGTRLLADVAMPLGLFTHLIFDASMQVMEPGAALLVVTKGVTESRRGSLEFGAERVMGFLQNSKQPTAREIGCEVLEAAAQFEQGGWSRLAFWRRIVRDDMTALVILRRA